MAVIPRVEAEQHPWSALTPEAQAASMYDEIEQSQEMILLSHREVNKQLLREVRRRKHKFEIPKLAPVHSGKIDASAVTEVDPHKLLSKLQRRPGEPPVTTPVAEMLVRSLEQQLKALTGPVIDLHLPDVSGNTHQGSFFGADGPRPRMYPEEEPRLIVVGDTHGQLKDVLHIMREHGPPSASTTYLFNGDIVDRGRYAVEIWLLLIAFKLRHPDSVHILRGNHENEQMIARPFKMGGGFSEECLAKYSRQLLSTFQRVFKLLPLFAVLQEEIFVVHGGLFRTTSADLQRLRSMPEASWRRNFPNPLSAEEVAKGKKWSDEEAIIFDAQWADPHFGTGWRQSSRGKVAVTFGEDVTHNFLDREGLALCIRSHRVPQSGRGFEFEHGGRLLTLFSASRYGGVLRNRGAVAVLRRADRATEDGESGGSSSSTSGPTSPLKRLSMHLVEHEVLEAGAATAQAPRSGEAADPLDQVRRMVEQIALEHEADVERHAVALVCCFREELWRRCRQSDPGGLGIVPRHTLCDTLEEVCGEIGWDKLLRSAAPGLEGEAVAYGEFLTAPRVRWYHLGTQQVIKMARATLQAELTLDSLIALFAGADHSGSAGNMGPLVQPSLAREGLAKLLPALGEHQLRLLAGTLFGDEPAPLSAVLHQLALFADPPDFREPWMRLACRRMASLIERRHGPPPLHCALIRFFQEIGSDLVGEEDFSKAVKSLSADSAGGDQVLLLDDARLHELFTVIDGNCSGTISFLELLLALDERPQQPSGPLFPALEGALPALLYVHRLSLLPILRVIDKPGLGRVSALNFVELAAALSSVVGRPLVGAARKAMEEELRGEDLAYNEVLGSFEVSAEGGPWRLVDR